MESLATLPRPDFVPVTSAERLEWALDDALDSDLDERFESVEHDADLGAELEELQRQKARLAALEARMIVRWDARQAWAADGSRSASAALARDAGLSPGTARALVARARKLRSMPATAKALANGEISVDHVDLLTRANQEWRDARFTEHEQMLVQQCTRLRYAQARQAISYWCQRADIDAAEEAGRRIDHRRYATTATTLDGEVVVNAVLDPVGGTAFADELERLEHLLYLHDQKCGNRRTIRQRRADALVEMANRSRTSPAGGLRPRPLITILVGEQSFRRTCELAAGTVITPGQVVPHLAEADIERITFEGRDRVIGVSRRRRFVGALRRAIEVRDRHCQHPCGCDELAARCDGDHITPRNRGGPTSQDNGRLLCPTHNRHPDKRDPRTRDQSKRRRPPRSP